MQTQKSGTRVGVTSSGYRAIPAEASAIFALRAGMDPVPSVLDQAAAEKDMTITLEELVQLEDRDRLFKVEIGAELERLFDVFLAGGAAEDVDGESLERRLGANPGENLKAAFLRHVEIEQNDEGQRVLGPIGEGAGPGEIVDDLLAIL